MSNYRATGSQFKSAKSDIKKIRLVYSRFSEEEKAVLPGIERDALKSDNQNDEGDLTKSKTVSGRNNFVATSFKLDNNVYPDMNFIVEELGSSTEVDNVFLHTNIEVTRDAEARYLYGVLKQFINFGKNRDHIVEDDLPFIDKYESLDATEKKELIDDLLEVSKGHEIKQRHLKF